MGLTGSQTLLSGSEIVSEPSAESSAKRKIQAKLFAVVIEGSNDFDNLLQKSTLRKAMRISAWISRLSHNSRHPSSKITGPSQPLR